MKTARNAVKKERKKERKDISILAKRLRWMERSNKNALPIYMSCAPFFHSILTNKSQTDRRVAIHTYKLCNISNIFIRNIAERIYIPAYIAAAFSAFLDVVSFYTAALLFLTDKDPGTVVSFSSP